MEEGTIIEAKRGNQTPPNFNRLGLKARVWKWSEKGTRQGEGAPLQYPV
jgi:hypothetical protein